METRKTLPVVLYPVMLLLMAPSFAAAADDGGKIFAEVCSECHTAKKNPLDKIHLSRTEWNETLERMLSYGAEIPKGKLPELLDFLVKTRGPAGTGDEGKK